MDSLTRPNKSVAFYSGLVAGVLVIVQFHVFDVAWLASPILLLIFVISLNAFIGLGNLGSVVASMRNSTGDADAPSPAVCMERFWVFSGGLFLTFVWIFVFPPD